MKNITVKINGKTKTLATANVVTKDGEPTVIKAKKNVNYELIDNSTNRAPQHIVTKRQGNDLHISFEEDGQVSDLIIEGFYNNDGALIGLAEDGQYYFYIPDTGEVADYVTQLQSGDIEGQALGGAGGIAPWWIAATTTGSGALPWLAGLAGVGAAGIALASNKSDSKADTTEPAPKPQIQTNNGSATITPTKDATTVSISYTDENGQNITITATKQPNGSWTGTDNAGNPVSTTQSPTKPSINPTTGQVQLPEPAIQDNSQVVANQNGQGTGTGTETAQVGTPVVDTAPPVTTPVVPPASENVGGGAPVSPPVGGTPLRTPEIIITKHGNSVSKGDVVSDADKEPGFIYEVKGATIDKPFYYFKAQVKPPAGIEPKVGDKVKITTINPDGSVSGDKEPVVLNEANIKSYKDNGYFSFFRIPEGSGKHTITAQFFDNSGKESTNKATEEVAVSLTPTKPQIAIENQKPEILLPSPTDKDEATEYVVIKYTDNTGNPKTVTVAKVGDTYKPVKADKNGEPVFEDGRVVSADEINNIKIENKDNGKVAVTLNDATVQEPVVATSHSYTEQNTADQPAGDTDAPTLDTAKFTEDGNVELTYNEPLDSDNPPVKEDFNVTVDGQPVTPTDVTIDGNKVKLTLPTPIKQGQDATVSYTDNNTDDNNAIQDEAGNDATPINDRPLTNDSTVQEQLVPVTISLKTDSQGPHGSAEDGITNNKTLVFGNLKPNEDWEYHINNGDWQKVGVAEAETVERSLAEITSNDVDGTSYTIEARLVGKDATKSEAKEILFDDQTTDPLVVVVSNDQVAGSTEANAQFTVYDSQENVIDSAKSDNFGNFEFNLNAGRTFQSGSSYKISYIDIAGNESDKVEFAYTNLPRINKNWTDSTNANKHAITVGDSSGGIGNGNIYGVGTTVDSGSGNDSLYVKGEIFSSTKINIGEGDDYLRAGYLSGTAGTPIKVDMGSGNDTIDLSGVVAGISSRDSQITLGDGDDVARFANNAFGGFVDGSAGYDTFIITNNAGGAATQGFQYLRGFEVIDLTGNQNNTLTNLTLENLTNAGQESILHIKGDSGDTVNIGNQAANGLGDSGRSTWSKSEATVREDGVTYDVWQNSSNDDLVVYIQQGINVI